MSKFIENYKKQTPEKQDYILQDVAKDLVKAQKFKRLCQLLTEFDYLQIKLETLGVGELIDDYDLLQNNESWQELRLIQKALYMSGDILDKDTIQLGKELTRLLAAYQYLPQIQRLFTTYYDKPWLCWLSTTISSPLAQPLIRTLTGHNDSVDAVAVTSDSKKIISGSYDKTLKVWDIETGKCIATFTAEAGINCVEVANDGVSIVAGDSSGNVHFWRLIGG